MSGKGKVAKVALAAAVVALLMLASLVYGVISVRRQNRAYEFVRYLVRQHNTPKPKEDSGKQGIWHKPADDRDRAAPSQQVGGDLAALPYVAGYNAAPSAKGVTVYDEAAASKGLNFLLSAHAPSAVLMDMKGNVLHEWRKEFASVWPRPPEPPTGNAVYKTYWRRAKPLADGGLLAMFMDFGLIRLDRDSKLVWAYAGRAHHDMFAGAGGEIYLLTREVRTRSDLKLESWKSLQPILE